MAQSVLNSVYTGPLNKLEISKTGDYWTLMNCHNYLKDMIKWIITEAQYPSFAYTVW